MNLLERQNLKWQILTLILEMKGVIAKPTNENFTLERNEVKCKSSGYTELYTDVVVKGDLSNMIDARLKSVTKEV